ncbi:hypothetical protein CR513_61819, partial [Mucuna pruriens]
MGLPKTRQEKCPSMLVGFSSEQINIYGCIKIRTTFRTRRDSKTVPVKYTNRNHLGWINKSLGNVIRNLVEDLKEVQIRRDPCEKKTKDRCHNLNREAKHVDNIYEFLMPYIVLESLSTTSVPREKKDRIGETSCDEGGNRKAAIYLFHKRSMVIDLASQCGHG